VGRPAISAEPSAHGSNPYPPRPTAWLGIRRIIFYHSDVDALQASVIAAGYRPDTAPRGAEWGERFFHLTDPDGHELSFTWPLR
jgi:uncharacterized glyoxalase superfamily protein PhnB